MSRAVRRGLIPLAPTTAVVDSAVGVIDGASGA